MSTDEDREWDAYLDRMTPPEVEEVLSQALADEEECQRCGGDGVILGDNYGWTGQPSERPCPDCTPTRGEP